MLAHLLENYFVGISLAETQMLKASGKTEFENDQHYCEHLLTLAKNLLGRAHYEIGPQLASEFAQGKPLFGHEPEAMLVRAGFVALYRNGRPWNEDAVKDLVLAGETENQYLIAAALATINVFSRIMETNEGARNPPDARAIFVEAQYGIARGFWPEKADFDEIPVKIDLCVAEFINGNMLIEDAVKLVGQIGDTAARPLRSVLIGTMIGFVNDDAAEAVSMAQRLTPDDFVAAAIASAFSATYNLRRPGMKQLLRARSIFSGTDGGNKQPDERDEHLKLVVDGIERRRKHFDDIRGWVMREDWWLYGD